MYTRLMANMAKSGRGRRAVEDSHSLGLLGLNAATNIRLKTRLAAAARVRNGKHRLCERISAHVLGMGDCANTSGTGLLERRKSLSKAKQH